MARCLSVRRCVSETLRYRHSWSHKLEFLENNFTAIGLTFLLSAGPNITDLSPREHLQILAGMAVRYRKIGSGRTKPASPKRLKIERKLLTAYIKSYTGFRLPPKCMILNDLWPRFKDIDSLIAAKMTKYMYSLVIIPTPCRVAGALSLLGLHIRVPVYLLTQNNQCPLRLGCDLPTF